MRRSGVLLYRWSDAGPLKGWLGHMGGPFWAREDKRAWSISKGLFGEDEDALAAAQREFHEEVGAAAPADDYLALGDFRQGSGKVITVFTAHAPRFAPKCIDSNTFELEWPARSGRMPRFSKIDDARWFPLEVAREKATPGQVAILHALAGRLGTRSR